MTRTNESVVSFLGGPETSFLGDLNKKHLTKSLCFVRDHVPQKCASSSISSRFLFVYWASSSHTGCSLSSSRMLVYRASQSPQGEEPIG